MPGCPVRWHDGPSRPCADHRGDDGEFAERAVAMGIDAPPPGRHDGDDDSAP